MKIMTRVIFLMLAFNFPALAEDLIFPVEKIRVGKIELKVEVAKSPQQQAQGLMFRKKLDQNSGMLFVYFKEQELSFWMKNTFIPLSIGFFNKNHELIEVQDMTPVTSEMQVDIPSYKSSGKAMYALEMNQGWFTRNKIKSKTKLLYPIK